MFQTALSRAVFIKQCHASKFVQNFRYFSSEIDFDSLVKKSKVVVFMKGTPESPMCGFSNTVVKILKLHGVKYDAYDVLSNEDMRKGIKQYTSWPTIPQVFINGEFIGGCDILTQMHKEKKLISELEKVGIKSVLSETQKAKKKTEKS